MATEKRLIDVDKAKKDFNLHFGGVSHAVIANKILDEQPTIDAVEVVRCKDCKKSGILEHNGKMFCKEPMGCLGCVPTKPNAFCSYGERRTDNG